MKKLDQSTISLLVGLAALLLVIIVLVVIGWLTSSTQKLTIQGTVEAREYRVSGKVAGRVEELIFQEGDTVSKGQIVVKLDSPELQAKIVQANAQSRAARAQRQGKFYRMVLKTLLPACIFASSKTTGDEKEKEAGGRQPC